MFKGTGITALDLDQGLQAALKNQKSYARSQVKDNETVNIASISHHIGIKLQAWAKTVPPAGINIAPDDDPSITSSLTRDISEDDDASLLDG